jgi:hypothetical protein
VDKVSVIGGMQKPVTFLWFGCVSVPVTKGNPRFRETTILGDW